MTEAEIDALKRGGHDFRKLYAAFRAATLHKERPTVILAKTKKGYGMGGAGESRMTVAPAEEARRRGAAGVPRPLRAAALRRGRRRSCAFLRPAETAPRWRTCASVARRSAARCRRDGGAAPRSLCRTWPRTRSSRCAPTARKCRRRWRRCDCSSGLLKDKTLGPRIVPIVADEARTFGMASLFRQIGIYSPSGQLYEPEDAGSMLYYREARDGQLLEEGITEAGALSSWIAAATSYSAHGEPMLPFYIYYSMFGFQRVGDLIWAAADQRGRGFLLGATAGRTTLGGEGLQHQDGSSHVIAATMPNCRAYDPAFACELAVIVDHGMRRMMEQHADEFYYVTRDERELRAAVAARGRRRRRDQGHVPAAIVAACHEPGPGSTARQRHDPARSDRRRGTAGCGLERRQRCLQRDELQRTRARCARSRTLESPASGQPRERRATSTRCSTATQPDRRRHRLRARVSAAHRRVHRARDSSRSAPTASAAAIRAQRCAGSSKSIAIRW